MASSAGGTHKDSKKSVRPHKRELEDVTVRKRTRPLPLHISAKYRRGHTPSLDVDVATSGPCKDHVDSRPPPEHASSPPRNKPRVKSVIRVPARPRIRSIGRSAVRIPGRRFLRLASSPLSDTSTPEPTDSQAPSASTPEISQATIDDEDWQLELHTSPYDELLGISPHHQRTHTPATIPWRKPTRISPEVPGPQQKYRDAATQTEGRLNRILRDAITQTKRKGGRKRNPNYRKNISLRCNKENMS
ncbi:hypothetical protein RF55_13768 [Lasius niger]|uniref:Uncharacterized protein n=1 Tax=Lasius niger TaxID=67767 RepID=A0A0J7K9K8_LASNI|nr:hypothetical protein RF55_13768 [Lasius niger]